MKAVEYSWKQGSRVNAKAEDFGKVVNRLEKKHGVVSPEAVVEEARPKDSPIHEAFEWDDSVAAEKYRTDQARYGINHLRVIVKKGANATQSRAYVNVVIGEQRGYVATARAMSDEDMAQQVLKDLEIRGNSLHREIVELRRLKPEADPRISPEPLEPILAGIRRERGLEIVQPTPVQ